MDTSPALRIITVAYNPGDELGTFAQSLQGATRRPYELVICDNGQDSTVVDAVADSDNRVRVLRFGENRGYGKAINAGADDYSGQWFVVANPDVRFEENAIDILLDETGRWPRAGVFGPRILTTDGDVYPSARRFPGLIDGVGHAILKDIWPSNPFSKRYRDLDLSDNSRTADWLSGACLLIRTQAFTDVGGFDDDYFMFFEDTQLGRDLHDKGWDSVYVPQARVCHDTSKSWRDRPAPMIKAHHKSAQTYFAKTHPHLWQAPLRGLINAGLDVHSRLQTRKHSAD